MIRSRLRDQSGSIPLAILASIVIGGAVAALFLVVQSGVMTSGRDRDFNAAVQVADAGLQDAFVELMSVEIGESTPACDTDGDGFCEGTMQDGSAYRWEYEQTASRMWTVTSVGTFGGSTRAVQAEIGERPLFAAAIVSDERFDYKGGGTGTTPFPLGGFNVLDFSGGNTGGYIETLFLYGKDNEPTGNAPSSDKWERAPGPALPNLGLEAFEPGGVCEGKSDSLENPLVRGEVYCLTGEASFKSDTALTVPEGDGPVKIYVRSGGMTVGPKAVNDGGDAVDLQIYIAEGAVVMNGKSSVSAAIYAPESPCTSNGQGNGGFAGGMICNTVKLNGNFDYDPTIGAIVDDTFAIRGWREEPSEAQEAAG